MKRMVLLAALHALAALRAEEPAVPAPPSLPEEQKAPKSAKYAAHDVELRLKDGSALRGELKGAESVTLKTSFGVLKFPIDEIYQLTHANESGAADQNKVAAAIKDLKSADAQKQLAAESALVEAGGGAVEPLFDLRGAAAPELKSRIDALLKRVIARKSDSPLSADSIRTAKFEARGVLQLEALKLSGRLGELTVKLADIESIRWLAHGVLKTLDLEAEISLRDWNDTGIDANLGESMSISASGRVVLFGSIQAGPSGNQNGDAQPFPLGSVIGRVGADGETFLIGDAKTWKPESAGRLYVRIYAADDVLQGNQARSRGRYSVRIATGPWSDDSTPGATGEGD